MTEPGGDYIWGTGRRKSAVARVRIRDGSGQIVINERPLETYFHRLRDHVSVRRPLEEIEVDEDYDVFCNVDGGGMAGQAGAIRLGLARALAEAHPDEEKDLRDAGLLTRDDRIKERKKYGRRGARASYQFSKR